MNGTSGPLVKSANQPPLTDREQMNSTIVCGWGISEMYLLATGSSLCPSGVGDYLDR